jgi:ADP-ribose pyrophosphatase YjhB (NUDIX family)
MYQKNSCCSYCGHRFPARTEWPKTCGVCGNKSYLNPLPVVVILLPIADGVVVVRRGIEPQKGTLTLPGGYIDCGETWQEGAQRELFEETGIAVALDRISLYDVQNGLDNTLVIFGQATHQPETVLMPFSSEETTEVALITRPIELGFIMHTRIVQRYFSETGSKLFSSEAMLL